MERIARALAEKDAERAKARGLLAEARREWEAMRDLRDAAIAESSEWAREVERLRVCLSGEAPSVAQKADLAAMREALEREMEECEGCRGNVPLSHTGAHVYGEWDWRTCSRPLAARAVLGWSRADHGETGTAVEK